MASSSNSANPLSHYRIVSTFQTHLVLEDTTTNSKALYKQYPIYLDRQFQTLYDELQSRRKLNSQNLMKLHLYLFDSNTLKNPQPNQKFGLLFQSWVRDFQSQLSRRRETGTNFWTEEELINTIESVLEGLNDLHSVNLIHGDIRPQHVVFCEDGFVKLADQFVMRSMYRKSREVLFQEASSYFAPEVVMGNGSNETRENDLWALGMLFLEAASLESSLQFYNYNTKQINLEAIEARLVKIRANYSPFFISLIAYLLSTNPSDRFKSHELIAEANARAAALNNEMGGNNQGQIANFDYQNENSNNLIPDLSLSEIQNQNENNEYNGNDSNGVIDPRVGRVNENNEDDSCDSLGGGNGGCLESQNNHVPNNVPKYNNSHTSGQALQTKHSVSSVGSSAQPKVFGENIVQIQASQLMGSDQQICEVVQRSSLVVQKIKQELLERQMSKDKRRNSNYESNYLSSGGQANVTQQHSQLKGTQTNEENLNVSGSDFQSSFVNAGQDDSRRTSLQNSYPSGLGSQNSNSASPHIAQHQQHHNQQNLNSSSFSGLKPTQLNFEQRKLVSNNNTEIDHEEPERRNTRFGKKDDHSVSSNYNHNTTNYSQQNISLNVSNNPDETNDKSEATVKHQALYSKIDSCIRKSEQVFHQSITATSSNNLQQQLGGGQQNSCSEIPRKSNAGSSKQSSILEEYNRLGGGTGDMQDDASFDNQNNKSLTKTSISMTNNQSIDQENKKLSEMFESSLKRSRALLEKTKQEPVTSASKNQSKNSMCEPSISQSLIGQEDKKNGQSVCEEVITEHSAQKPPVHRPRDATLHSNSVTNSVEEKIKQKQTLYKQRLIDYGIKGQIDIVEGEEMTPPQVEIPEDLKFLDDFTEIQMIHYNDGSFYEGEVQDRMRHGFGTYCNSEGLIVYQGEWKDDLFDGRGVLYNSVATELQYQFDFRNFNTLDTSWVQFEGEFVEGTKNGNGQLSFSNGETFSGTFSMGQVAGVGTFNCLNGVTFAGEWDNNLLVYCL